MNNETNNKMENLKEIIEKLTKEQKETFNSLVNLGDSEFLALETVLNIKQRDDNSFYEFAYYS
tara:strand:- start:359 stop:547 length:189 start_codon:yes stop_codon:yes gene_type:complete